ncbi:tRNA (adenosine(37)-N6)-threonylcarbamoyltransferase complex dimerization subunit type 1 TsaB [Rhizobium sp. SSA_523]|uniref:tRNA (adenosine(37)-N6)-threonylcarbamoyltransferase complex dimerization subunit type 1 TsaB n=1 Tax=Rhizobium sp. SSA_523 TaxID=2952477 RepID=UPI002091D409|nr:tRNA (adenosine(37)-N6)-threonylcarbamoyltransferase complex dimerization subunit type 1 TsaB [Rhizobium sp. SSA_523]MCO5732631.1 tRNA (adenosine(37)-N6)-threonylcarbamoyltransferase complex dimerization subunit type 1 TsaB [Rhizobium sp. SSA_523]WKC23737.1 tRNA (adenosine(37)-N6)-threonylcarbamoyltransferase complex dimerization subunit type 1 TsaB [Rhizobium sp. SSA_523]
MKVLAIDTAGADCSAAVFDASRTTVLAQETDLIGKGHAERLMAMIEKTMAAADLKLDDLDRIAVTVGPGSFTGIRVGVAAARGLALALSIPCVGVTTLETMAASHLQRHPGQAVVAAMDAKREQIYAQAFSDAGEALSAPSILSLDELRQLLADHEAQVTGSAAALLRDASASSEPDRFEIATVARIGAMADQRYAAPRPLYLRGPDAKPQDGFALARA